jgi:Ca2+-binding RTX toxin-like protein
MTILFGTEQNDELFLGGSGVGIAVGLEGDDTIVSPLNAVAPGSQLFGNLGADSIRSRGVGDTSRGGQDDDKIVNESGQAFLFGDLGDDDLEGREGQSTLLGGAGDDSVVAAGPNNLIFGDLLASFSLTSADTVSGNDTCIGLEGGDTCIGGGGDDYIKGGPKEASILFGNAGKDSCYAGADGDSVYGGKDADYMIVGSDASADGVLFVGGDGSDKLIALTGDNHILAGDAEGTTLAGNDYLWVDAGEGHLLFGNLGNDKLIYSGSGSSTLLGGQGDDSCYAEDADGALLSGDKGSDYLFGSGVDNSTFEGGGGTWSDTIVLDSGAGNMLMGDNGSDASDDFIYVHGSAAADGNNTLAGGAGNDYLCSKGGAGSDANVLTGAEGDDTYYFGAGDSITSDSDGKNVYFGFAGAEAVKVTIGVNDVILPGASGQYTFESGLPTVAFVGTGGVVTGDGKDFISIDNAASETSTEGGNDTLTIGMLDSGTINAGAGDDVLNFTGTDNAGDVNLGSGNDTLTLPAFQGGSITGEAGDDIFNLGDVDGGNIDGGAGKDLFNAPVIGGSTAQTTLSGGADNDTIYIGDIGPGGGVLDGGAGNDIILGGTNAALVGTDSGATSLGGGDGDDFLRGRQYCQDTIDGGAGNDIISGGLSKGLAAEATQPDLDNQVAAAVSGQTSIFDGDVISGGAGNDIFVIAGLNETGIVQSQFVKAGTVAINAAGTDDATFNAAAIADPSSGFIPLGIAAGSYNGALNVDTITDFNTGDDTLGLFADAFNSKIPELVGTSDFATFDSGTFGAVGILDTFIIGKMNTAEFGAGGAKFNVKAEVGDILYDTSSGGVYVGLGGSAVLVAVLDGAPTVTNTDFAFVQAGLSAGITFF